MKAAEYRERLNEYLSEFAADAHFVGATPMRFLGRLATGHSSDVFLAERATRLSERLVVKRLRAREDAELFENEQRVLAALANSGEQGASYFTTLLPQRVAYVAQGGEISAVFREPIGFVHTLESVAIAHGFALDPRHAVWIGRRVLELLSFVHRSGFVHGAVLPAHVLIHADEHGARLVGFSCAATAGTHVERIDPRFEPIYPEEMLSDRGVSPRDDLSMLARCLLWAMSALPQVPNPLAEFLNELASGAGAGDAWQAQQHLSQVARESFGAPRFVKLEVP
ncbi:MAG: hypothetical protein ACOY0T_33510 [Myxococcota bacterium]